MLSPRSDLYTSIEITHFWGLDLAECDRAAARGLEFPLLGACPQKQEENEATCVTK